MVVEEPKAATLGHIKGTPMQWEFKLQHLPLPDTAKVKPQNSKKNAAKRRRQPSPMAIRQKQKDHQEGVLQSVTDEIPPANQEKRHQNYRSDREIDIGNRLAR
jgi:hypothetical protein